MATCKHAIGNDIENVGGLDEITRYNHDARISVQDQADYYLRPFEACVRDAKVESLMCGYNAVNGIPQCADSWLMQTMIREYWGWNWTGTYITSDCFALDTIQEAEKSHNYTHNVEDTLRISFHAGVDTECGIVRLQFLKGVIERDPSLETDLDASLIRVFESFIKLGYFDSTMSQPYRSIKWKDVNTPATRKLASFAAEAGMVLLKNDGNLLPIKKPSIGSLSVALIGDWVNATKQMLGGYSGPPPFVVSPLDAFLAETNVNVSFVLGFEKDEIMRIAEAADIVFYIGGLDTSSEHEMLDRTTLDWNTTQKNIIRGIADLHKPFVILQTGGGQLDDAPWLTHSGVTAIVWIGYPGQAGGEAIANTIFGRSAPAGRLPVTQYDSAYTKMSPTIQDLRPDLLAGNLGQTYQWYTGKPTLPFGYGLHYTTFDVTLNNASLPNTPIALSELPSSCLVHRHLDHCLIANFTIGVENTGVLKSSYAALAFVSGEYGPAPHPLRALAAYTKLHDILPGCKQTAQLPIKLAQLARFDARGRRLLYPGTYHIAIDTAPELLSFEIELTGDKLVLEEWPRYDREAPNGSV